MNLDYMRSPEKAMPVEVNAARVLRLRIWHCKFESLAPLAAFTNLEHLTIATFPDETLDVLGNLTQLRHLSVLHFPKVTDLAPLAKLQRLESLSLSRLPSWDSSGRWIQVQTLEPLAQLPALRAIELFGVVPPDRSLGALAANRHIKTARFSGYPKAEVSSFYSATGAKNEYIVASDA